ncbi:hypothetical protein Q7Y16_09940 [Glaesserella parasuis]|nr:hypothetical protein [Glaesserella parasuis]
MNLSQVVGAVVSSKLATYHELQTVYGLEDALDLLEVFNVDSYNNRKANNG